MAPQRLRVAQEDSRSDASSTREKHFTTTLLPIAVKGRRNVSSNTTVGSNLKDVTTVPATSEDSGGQQNGADTAGGMNWSSLDTSILHAYRHAHRLNVPSAFTSPYNQMVLTGPGLGRHSPTMARRKDRRRVSKEQLTLAVRKDFNAAAVSEQEVVTSFLYSIHNQNKNFRMRFAPSRSR